MPQHEAIERAKSERKGEPTPCDWCNDACAWRVEIYPGSLMYAYACFDHLPLLEAYAEARPKRRKFK